MILILAIKLHALALYRSQTSTIFVFLHEIVDMKIHRFPIFFKELRHIGLNFWPPLIHSMCCQTASSNFILPFPFAKKWSRGSLSSLDSDFSTTCSPNSPYFQKLSAAPTYKHEQCYNFLPSVVHFPEVSLSEVPMNTVSFFKWVSPYSLLKFPAKLPLIKV